MKFNFDFTDSKPDSPSPHKSPTPQQDTHWIPLTSHPLFTATTTADAPPPRSDLLAYDTSSRLYYWDSTKKCLHRISIRLGDPEPTSVLAATPSKVLQTDVEVDFSVSKISINRNGTALVLAGSDGLCVMFLYGKNSSRKENVTVCRTVSVGSQIYFSDSSSIRTLQVLWHPYSDIHLGVISSDSVFRLFDLSSDFLQPEQEYYLQPTGPGRSKNASSICPVDFSFGGDHMWDRFTVFVLFSDGSIYILCPVIPFGSAHKFDSILEIYTDAQSFRSKSANQAAVKNSSLAISWLEATFPELKDEAVEWEDSLILKAQPYALFDASLCLQGSLRKVHHGGEDEYATVRGTECEGCAVSFLYNVVSKDSILVTAWSGGQLQIDALADEIQPVWIAGSLPRLRVDSHDHIVAIAMICESTSGEIPVVKLDHTLDHTVWLGHPPPLLRLAIVDLALPKKSQSGSNIRMFADPLLPERIFSVHDCGVDSILLHFLPFTSQSCGKDETVRTPSVHPVLSTCQADNSSPLCGFITLSDSFGYSWVIGITSMQECVVLEMKTWDLLLPVHVDVEKNFPGNEGWKEGNTPDIISKELLSGPKVVFLPQASPNLRSIAADSIEGRSALHQYFKLFHENYVEYAHKVYFELKHHEPQLKRIIDEQNARLTEAEEKLLKVEEKQSGLDDRIDHAINVHNLLEERLQRLRNLPGAHKKPLSKAEREFKSELDHFTGVELDALRTSIDTLRARLKRSAQTSKANASNQQRQISMKHHVRDVQMSQLKSSLAKLSLVNSENTKKVKILESALKSKEISK
ncbi:nuclear pore complex protein NUP88 [Mercurialis annua]|uniref:nuclear pore complex protein NUP88 n=1 Tax=Mercurialis annua TaxID=3986 RepID=UPI00216082BF|nr:nuclear pore complex protein NUP88 [Mercurialis annua]